MRVIGVCADDLGFAPGIAETAFELAAQGRLSDGSCLVTGPVWPAAATFLRRQEQAGAAAAARWGLHLNLTHGVPLSPALRRHWPEFPALATLLARAHVGAVPQAALADELAAQLDAFAAALGRAPAFIDGHQHVHHLPGVRGLVLALARSAGPAPLPVRNTGRILGPGFAFKRAVIEGSGGRALARRLRRDALPHNASLIGIYDFAADGYRPLVRRWLAGVPERGALLVCHPARLIGADPDGAAMAAARAAEAGYFTAAFGDDLAEAKVTLGDPWAGESSSAC